MAKQLTTKIDKQFLGRLCADAISNLQKACEKHPTFPMHVSGLTLEEAEGLLRRSRQANDEPDRTVCMIANEEELEMEVAILSGYKRSAYDELVDLLTVWLRVGVHLNDYVPNKAITQSGNNARCSDSGNHSANAESVAVILKEVQP